MRWPNLVFIAITQYLFHFFITEPVLVKSNYHLQLSNHLLHLLVIASVLIAAAGYIINDYFDLNIDIINKPNKLIVDKYINRRWVILWHVILSSAGIAISFYVGHIINKIAIGFFNAICVVLLFIYSVSLKKKLLSGNFLISVLTAWVLIVLVLCEADMNMIDLNASSTAHRQIFRLGILYAGFAFVISLIREVIKDIEDIDGDRKYGCNTMPIAWGINASKVFVAVWLIVLIGVVGILQIYAITQLHWYVSASYCILFIIIPLALVIKKLYAAKTVKDYHSLSTMVKLIMFTGILSMIFFRFSI